MITFLIPLKSGKNVKNDDVFRGLLSSTLKTCRAVPGARTLIVCNRSTPLPSLDPQVDLLIVPETGEAYGDLDKGKKLEAGRLRWLQSATDADHLMPLDGDDLVSRHMNSAACPRCNTVLMAGFLQVYDRLYLQQNFYWRNGSSHLLCRDYVAQPPSTWRHERGFMFHQSFDHGQYRFLREFRALVVQRVGHGENVFCRADRNWLKTWLKWRFFSEPFSDEFGCSSVPHSRLGIS